MAIDHLDQYYFFGLIFLVHDCVQLHQIGWEFLVTGEDLAQKFHHKLMY